MHLAGRRRTEPPWLYAAAGALMLGGPVGHELYVNHYPARPEAFALPLIAMVTGAILGAGSRLIGGLLGTVVFGGLLFAFADLQLNLERFTYTAVVLGGCVALAQLLVRHRAAITALSLGAFYIASLVRPSIAPSPPGLNTARAAGSTSPLLVHVILDEQWGVGGLRAAGDTVTADFLADFYLSRGFELYESAYSRYLMTEESIPDILSLGETLVGQVQRTKSYRHSVIRNPYFERLRSLGYDIRAYQTTYIDFCRAANVPVASCEVQSGNSIANIGFLDGRWLTRGTRAARYFLATRSHVYETLVPPNDVWRRSATGGALAALRQLAGAIAAHPGPGNAWFVHVLLPHRPFQADEECRVVGDPSRPSGYGYPREPSDSLRRATLSAYAGQIRCAHRALGRVLAVIDSAVGADRSIVIVQGDHGSRMHAHDFGASFEFHTADEINADFATLLAVRRPGVPAGIHAGPIPVQDALWALARAGFAGPLPATWEHYISRKRNGVDEAQRPLAARDMPWARRPQ